MWVKESLYLGHLYRLSNNNRPADSGITDRNGLKAGPIRQSKKETCGRMVPQCWSTVADGDPALSHHWINVGTLIKKKLECTPRSTPVVYRRSTQF